MRTALGLVGLLIALAIGYRIYFFQIEQVTVSQASMPQVSLVSVRADLLALAKAEKLYFASNGTYALLEELQRSGLLSSFPRGNGSGYLYSAEVDGAEHFCITASPMDSSRADRPTLAIDETLRISP